MLHLINSIYIAVDETIDLSVDRIVISKKYGTSIDTLIDDITEGYLLAFAPTYDQLVGPNQQFPSLLNLLEFAIRKSKESGKDLRFYVDQEGLADLATNFYKALLPQATSADIFRIINCYQKREKLDLYNFDMVSDLRNMPSAENTLSVSASQVDSAFARSTVKASDYTQLVKNNISGISLELMLATYSRNGRLKEELSNVFKSFVADSIALIANDLKDHFINCVFDKKFQRLFNLPEITLANIETVLANPSYPVSVFFDKTIWQPPRTGRVFDPKSVLQNIPTAKLKTMGDLSKTWLSQYTGSNGAEMLEWKIWNYVDLLHSDDWSSVISDALNENFLDNPVINKSTSNINVYLYYYILDRHQNNKNGLTPFTINGFA